MENLNKKIPQKRSVTLLVFLSIITLGIYPAIWYLKRVSEFDNLRTEKKLSKTMAIIFLLIVCLGIICWVLLSYYNFSYFLSIINTFITGAVLSSPSATMGIISYISSFLSILTFIFYIILAFTARAVINETLERKGTKRKIHGFFTFLFNILYLQYEINRTIDDREYEKRIGPWVWFIILILLPLLFILIYSIVGNIVSTGI